MNEKELKNIVIDISNQNIEPFEKKEIVESIMPVTSQDLLISARNALAAMVSGIVVFSEYFIQLDYKNNLPACIQAIKVLNQRFIIDAPKGSYAFHNLREVTRVNIARQVMEVLLQDSPKMRIPLEHGMSILSHIKEYETSMQPKLTIVDVIKNKSYILSKELEDFLMAFRWQSYTSGLYSITPRTLTFSSVRFQEKNTEKVRKIFGFSGDIEYKTNANLDYLQVDMPKDIPDMLVVRLEIKHPKTGSIFTSVDKKPVLSFNENYMECSWSEDEMNIPNDLSEVEVSIAIILKMDMPK
jgi:hypothetical protein